MNHQERDGSASSNNDTPQQQRARQPAVDGNIGAGMPRQVGATSPTAARQALQQLKLALRSPNSPDQQNRILHILKSNPPLVAAFIKQRQDFGVRCLGCEERENYNVAPLRENTAETREAHKFSIHECVQSLVHAVQCEDASCQLGSCQRMKRVVQHLKTCGRRTSGGCPICRQLVALCCHHARHCREAKCPVPFCFNIKQKLKQQQHHQRLQQAQLLRRSVARDTDNPTASSSKAMEHYMIIHGIGL